MIDEVKSSVGSKTWDFRTIEVDNLSTVSSPKWSTGAVKIS